ncbi:trinucleotide repeat-containing gene 6B protein isoform X1 [Fopius arisanus]|uniref:Trinucleotide repeat-containing gene 6B protein isoform X1 n=1 Tax=Fopius arisanus TaxID=64838 RepID=A0A9R1TFM8_9HYME|nr:PREDICTED: trinucleotide repeat-containing gene 6B protein-like isoform X1 [Fopius arisanus]XP_011308212.1 PREDICTED: trinucleotide repeat-containing gene 6B protein-like isoform X1 [Fopius arisanus]
MNASNSSSLGFNGNDSGICDQDGPSGSSRHSLNSSDSSESRRRISISEYKQRKKPAEAALDPSIPTNNNHITLKSETGISPPSSRVAVSHQNGPMVFNNVEEYYAHIYCLTSQGQLPSVPEVASQGVPQAPPSAPAPSYPYWGQSSQPPATTTESRLPKMEEWLPTPTFSQTFAQTSSEPIHNGESPTPHFYPPLPPQEKTPKMTPASELTGSNEATSYREWRKRKYGTEDSFASTSSNNSKFRKTDSWKDKGGPRNGRRPRQNQNSQDNWNTGAGSSGMDSWDDDSAPKAASGGLDSWDDGSSAPQANSHVLDSWDNEPAPQANKSALDNLESWDDGGAPQASQSIQEDSWNGGGASRHKVTAQNGLDSWDDAGAPPAASNYDPWGSSSGPQAGPSTATQNGLESWDDAGAPPAKSNYGSWEATSAPAPSKSLGGGLESWDDISSAPQASQAALDSWDNASTAPPAAADSWNNPAPASNYDNSTAQSWDTGNSSRGGSWGMKGSQRGFRENKGGYRGNKSRNDSNNRSRSGSRDYRGGSRSSDNSDSGYSNRGNRGSRGRRSGSRDSGSWNRNDRDKRSWNSGKNFGDRGNDRNDSRSSWDQAEASTAGGTTGESWDDDVAAPQSSKEFAGSWGNQGSQDVWGNSSANNYDRGVANYPSTSSALAVSALDALESWDDEVPRPQAAQEPLVAQASGGNSGVAKSNMVKALCTTCSFEIVHRCKFEQDCEIRQNLKPGELFTCPCGMAFLHERDCIQKVGENFAPINMETALIKQVGRSHVYVCKECNFKFILENLKDSSHFFKQMTNKKGDKIRQTAAINDPEGIGAFTTHIERINNIACLGMDSGATEKALKDKMSSIGQCSQGCCTIYHDCKTYEQREEGETV